VEVLQTFGATPISGSLEMFGPVLMEITHEEKWLSL